MISKFCLLYLKLCIQRILVRSLKVSDILGSSVLVFNSRSKWLNWDIYRIKILQISRSCLIDHHQILLNNFLLIFTGVKETVGIKMDAGIHSCLLTIRGFSMKNAQDLQLIWCSVITTFLFLSFCWHGLSNMVLL